MERNVLRARRRLTASTLALVLLAPLSVAMQSGCGNKLDRARTAWADGEGDFDEAEELYREAMQKPKTKEEAKKELAAIYSQKGRQNKNRPKEADKYFTLALELDPQSEEALEGHARALIARGMPDKALAFVESGAARGNCKPCTRVLAGLLIDRGDASYRANQFQQAESDYVRAAEILPNAHVALGIARARLAMGKTAESYEALKTATDLIGVQDLGSRQQFLELRKFAVMAALTEEKPDVADKLLDLVPDGVGAEEQVDLAIEVAIEMRKRNKPELAVDRLETLIAHANEGKLKVGEARIKDLRALLTGMYIARSSSRLSKGDLAGADADLVEALTLRPGEPTLMLMRVLVLVGKKENKEAENALSKIDPKTDGYGKVLAMLSANKVHELIAAGKVDAARSELERAKAKAPNLPEVHVATAAILALTEVEGIKKKEAAALKKTALVKYDGKVTRMGEALSELDWSRQSIAAASPDDPFRGPGTEQRIEEISKAIATKYPFKVKFNASSKPIFVLRNDGTAQITAKLKCGWTASTAKLAPQQTSKVTLARPGYCDIEYGGKVATMLAEPYTEVELSL